MALNLRSPEADAMATELARLTGQTKTRVVTEALRERLAGLRRERLPPPPAHAAPEPEPEPGPGPGPGPASSGGDPASPLPHG